MRTRTRLTSPPGEEPDGGDGVESRAAERYSPALPLPTEPDVPGRHRKLAVVLAVLAVLALLGWAAVQVISANQAEDPSLEEGPATEAPEATPGPEREAEQGTGRGVEPAP